MIPTTRNIVLIFLLVLCGIVVGVWKSLESFWLLFLAAVLVFNCLDLLSLYFSKKLELKREMQLAMPVGQWAAIEISLYNPKSRPIVIELTDFYPDHSLEKGLGEEIRVDSEKWTKFVYHIKPEVRGNFKFLHIQYRIFGPLGLWKRNFRVNKEQAIRVYPDFAKVIEYELLVHEQRQGMLGIKKQRRRGEGLNFEQLREYRKGDMIRQIDWNATSRKNKLISREYQDERDQRIIFLVDCGRRMRASEEGLSHFDQTLNATLLLTYVALRQGDSVGFMTFSGDEERWFSPRKGANTVNTLLNTVYDIQPSEHEADYAAAAKQLMVREKKRALVILITNIRDEDSEELMPAIKLLKRRHAVLIASMKDKMLSVGRYAGVNSNVPNLKQAMQVIALERYKQYRAELQQKLRAQKVFLLDVNPDKLAISLVNSYFRIKSAALL